MRTCSAVGVFGTSKDPVEVERRDAATERIWPPVGLQSQSHLLLLGGNESTGQ